MAGPMRHPGLPPHQADLAFEYRIPEAASTAADVR
jgi:hypothetical protein